MSVPILQPGISLPAISPSQQRQRYRRGSSVRLVTPSPHQHKTGLADSTLVNWVGSLERILQVSRLAIPPMPFIPRIVPEERPIGHGHGGFSSCTISHSSGSMSSVAANTMPSTTTYDVETDQQSIFAEQQGVIRYNTVLPRYPSEIMDVRFSGGACRYTRCASRWISHSIDRAAATVVLSLTSLVGHIRAVQGWAAHVD